MLSHDDITLILKAAREEALKNNWPVCISVVDDGGHLLALERLDGCAPTGIIMNSCKSILLLAWAPPLMTLIIGTGISTEPVPPR